MEKTNQYVRISSAGFLRILDKKERFVLIINKNRSEKGERHLAPIGGAIKITDSGRKVLKNLLGIGEDAFEGEDELRFKVGKAEVNKYREWFLARKNREIDPRREIIEELIEETNLVVGSGIAYLHRARFTHMGYYTETGMTIRFGQEGQETIRFIEIFDPDKITETALRKILLKQSEVRGDIIRFVTRKEIENGVTIDGIKIASVSQSLLEPQPTIPPVQKN